MSYCLINLRLLAVAVLLMAFAAPACAQEAKGGAKEEVHAYAAVGRVKWRIPADFPYYVGVPRRGATGPRIACSGRQFECDLAATSRGLSKPVSERLEQLLDVVRRDEFNTRPPALLTFGSRQSIHYVVLTDPQARYGRLGALGGGFRHWVSGFAEKGPALFTLEIGVNDESDLPRMLRIVDDAELLDALGILAWRLGDLKAVCEEHYPRYAQANESAFAASQFVGVDVPAAIKAALAPEESLDNIRAQLPKSRAAFARSLDVGPETEATCRSFPRILSESLNGLPSQ